MTFKQIIYFYIIFVLFIVNSKEVVSRKRDHDSKGGSSVPSSPTISAVLLECPKVQRRTTPKPDCERQMMVQIRVSPTFQIETLEKFLLLDEVYDQRRQTKAKLMSPYLIEISRGEPVIMYPLQFSKSIRCDTCGHKSANKTTHGNCAQQPLVNENNFAAFRNDIGSVAAATAAPSQLHPSRRAQQETAQHQQQQNDNEVNTLLVSASMEKSTNPRTKPSEKIESKKKLPIGIMDAPTSVQVKNPSSSKEAAIPYRDRLSNDVDNNGAIYAIEYDLDEYDERNLNDDTLTEQGEEEYNRNQNSFRNKRLKMQPSPFKSAKLDHASTETEQLFREAERQSEAARLDTIRAFRMKHAHPVGRVVGTSALGSDGVAGYGLSRLSNAGKPHVAGKHEDCIRPRGEFYADGADVDVDDDAHVDVSEKTGRGQQQNLGIQPVLLGKYEQQPDEVAVRKTQKPHAVGAIHKDKEKLTDATFAGNSRLRGSPFNDVVSRENAFPSQPREQHRQEPADISLFGEDFDAHKVGSNGDDEDYDTADASVRDSSVIESKSNKGEIDEIATVAGGMGDEFYWNTLNYPRGEAIEEFGRNALEVRAKTGNFHATPEHSSPTKLSTNRKNANIKARDKMKYKSDSGEATLAKNFHKDQRTSYDNFAHRAVSKNSQDDKSETTNNVKKDGSQTNENFFNKSKMKIRSSDGAIDGGGVVETSGMYTGKDGVVPAFPLNGYPGYIGVKVSQEYIPPPHSKSIYTILENEPQELLPHQPAYAKEIADPNLTANDKFHLLDVLTPNNDPDLTRTKKKRSYLMYDDLTMRDTYEQYDEMDMKQPLDMPLSEERLSSSTGGEASCKTCNDQKCHATAVDGKGCLCDRQGRNCKCMPKAGKKIRSVSDAWYSVFNMSAPLQFLTTRVGIYRKRHGAWWRIAPSITLTSLSGIYANGNLSILFSSHVDIFQLRRPLSFENHKLLIPHDGDDVSALHQSTYKSIDPDDILAIDKTKFDFNAIHDDTGNDDNPASAKRSLCHAAISAAERRRKRHSHSSTDEVLSIGDLGYFPGSMNILEQCPSDPEHLCLNMLDEEVPVKIKQPFLENALIYSGEYKVRIASVISDATTKGALQVAVVLVNEDCVAHEFAICICNCPMTCGAKTMVKKDLAPHVGETISFLLPLEENRDTKLYCNVEVKSPDQKVISKRKFIVEPTARCLCIWDCECHCVPDLISHDDYNVCHKLGDYEEHAAGFIDDGRQVLDQELTGWRWFWWRINHYAFSLLLCMLFLGIIKAILGAVVLRRIDRCGYDYLQPLQKYDYASRCRRFFINTVFFVVLPFIFCCKCFTPTEEDLLTASTEWQCSLMQHELSDDSGGEGDAGAGKRWTSFGRHNSGNEGGYNANDNGDDYDEETILSQHFESGDGSQVAAFEESPSRLGEYLINACAYDDEEEERDTNYVLRALTESRQSIRKLLESHCSDDLDLSNPRAKEADELVRRLVDASIVYRTFDVPLSNVDIPVGQRYSIRGYFVPSIGPEYQYLTPSPLAQLRRITANTIAALLPPVILRAEQFSRVYTSKLEVLDAGDLSVDPPEDAPCINSTNTANESQLTTLRGASQSPQPPVGGLVSIANHLAIEQEPVPADDIAERSHRIADANNGSDLTTKQKDLP